MSNMTKEGITALKKIMHSMIIYIKEVLKRMFKDLKDYKWAIILFGCYYFLIRHIFHAFCPLLIITGLPCPGCGMTRAIYYMLTGQITRSLNLNPSAVLWILLGAWFIFRRYLCGKKVTGLYPLMGGAALMMIGIYVFRMATEFPGYPPMVYRRNNILEKNISFYKDILRLLFPI